VWPPIKASKNYIIDNHGDCEVKKQVALADGFCLSSRTIPAPFARVVRASMEKTGNSIIYLFVGPKAAILFLFAFKASGMHGTRKLGTLLWGVWQDLR
jgi:hypothetical protein